MTSRRADAQRNRDRLLAAAEAALNAHGVGASLDDIAKAAGVGNATLYRHFPTRAKLIEAVYDQRIRALCDLAGELAQAQARELAGAAEQELAAGRKAAAEQELAAARDLDPAAALCEWLRAMVVLITDSRLLAEALRAADDGPAGTEPPRMALWHTAMHEAADPLLTAARDAGAVRPDLDILELMALVGAVARAGGPVQAERFLDILLEGIIPRPPQPENAP
jgi:AcrR family transcriptional regulator